MQAVLRGVVTLHAAAFSVQCRHPPQLSCCPFENLVEMLASLQRCEVDPKCSFGSDWGLPLQIICRNIDVSLQRHSRKLGLHSRQTIGLQIVEDLANTAARANASGGTRVASPKAAHMATAAYGLQAPRKPIHTATESYGGDIHTHMQSLVHGYTTTT